MWPFTPYPEHSPSEVDGKTYDYIVVGGTQPPTKLRRDDMGPQFCAIAYFAAP